MPETGWAVSYLFALSRGDAEDRAELASYCYEIDVDPDQLCEEMLGKPAVSSLADPESLNYEAYPLTMAVLRSFRASRHYRSAILDKMALGSDTMLDLGNLYTAALPAWMAAGFEQALQEDSLQVGEEVLTLGYGSGDAAEVIPFFMAEGWRESAAKIQFAAAMQQSVDLSVEQYEALHDGRRVNGLDYVPNKEFVIDRVGGSDERHFTDLGIEYYRYVG
jgi:hydroxymethylglutaryl-CoA synthase